MPLLVIGTARSGEGRPRATLLWFAMLGFALYNYVYYLAGASLNAFFPIYLAAVLVSVFELILAASSSDIERLGTCFSAHVPKRILGGFLVLVGTGLSAAWLLMWAAYIFAGVPTPVDTGPFHVVAAIDLSIIAPSLVLGGVLLWRGPW